MPSKPVDATTPESPKKRKPWVTPRVVTMRAGSAENGFSEKNQDGAFTTS
jgi:hypothetical protein